MADWTPPSEAKIVPAGAWTPPPEAKVVGQPPVAPPDSGASTTAPGLAASFARGAAPYAAGAAFGAAAGAPIGGVGAVPGAMAGILATGATELAGDIYNPIAGHFGWSKIGTPQELTDRALDAFGIKRPNTPIEHAAESVGGMLPLATGPGKAVAGALELGEMVMENRAGAAEKWIKNAYSRAIKPSTTGADTVAQRRSALSEIVEYKPGLSFTDAEGKVVASARLPESVEQFSQAIDQTKSKIFNEWNALAEASGDAGARVDVSGVVSALRAKAADPVLQRTAPGVSKEALAMADRFEASGPLSPPEAQRQITAFNNRLKAYYKTPTPEGTSAKDIEETAVRPLRQALDQTIEQTTAPGYQDLKRRYGSLVAIEGDVDRAARRVANRELGGGIMGRGIDIASITELAYGLAAHDWKTIGAAALTKGAGEYVKWRREPNRVIKELFQAAEKHHKSLPEAPTVTPRAPPPSGPTGGTTAGGTGGGGIPGPSANTPPPPGGISTPRPTRYSPLPVQPPQAPRSDFEGLISGGNEMF